MLASSSSSASLISLLTSSSSSSASSCESKPALASSPPTKHASSPPTKDASSPTKDDEDEVCSVCFNGDWHEENAIVFCDRCNIPVHQACYGIAAVPEGDWFCRVCESGGGKVQCILCPCEGGAFKKTTDGQWAHVLCAIWIPETCFLDSETMEPISGVDTVDKARMKLSCSLCGKKSGACIQCSAPKCSVPFHPYCAQNQNLRMEVKEVDDEDPLLLAFCQKHKDVVIEKDNLASMLQKRVKNKKKRRPKKDEDSKDTEATSPSLEPQSSPETLVPLAAPEVLEADKPTPTRKAKNRHHHTKPPKVKKVGSKAGRRGKSEKGVDPEDSDTDSDVDVNDVEGFLGLVGNHFRSLESLDFKRLGASGPNPNPASALSVFRITQQGLTSNARVSDNLLSDNADDFSFLLPPLGKPKDDFSLSPSMPSVFDRVDVPAEPSQEYDAKGLVFSFIQNQGQAAFCELTSSAQSLTLGNFSLLSLAKDGELFDVASPVVSRAQAEPKPEEKGLPEEKVVPPEPVIPDPDFSSAIVLRQLQAVQRSLSKQVELNASRRSRLLNRLDYQDSSAFETDWAQWERQTQEQYRSVATWQSVRLALYSGIKDSPWADLPDPKPAVAKPRRPKDDELDDLELEDLDERESDLCVCCVCFDGDSTEENPIVFCERCNISVHKSCYGIDRIPEDDWFCLYCQAHQSPEDVKTEKKRGRAKTIPVQDGSTVLVPLKRKDKLPCALCPEQGGALKQTDDGRWVHIVCALWIPRIHISDLSYMQPILNVKDVLTEHSQNLAPCVICHKDVGACLQCSSDGCSARFHVLCGWYYGLYYQVASVDMNCYFYSFCPQHTPLHALYAVSESRQAGVPRFETPVLPCSLSDVYSKAIPANTATPSVLDLSFLTPIDPIPTSLGSKTVLDVVQRSVQRLKAQHETRNRGRAEQTRKAKLRRKRRELILRKRRLRRQRGIREDSYEFGRCAVCFKTNEDVLMRWEHEQLLLQRQKEEVKSEKPVSQFLSSSKVFSKLVPQIPSPLSGPEQETKNTGRLLRCDRCEIEVHPACYGVRAAELAKVDEARKIKRAQMQEEDSDEDVNELLVGSGWLCRRCESSSDGRDQDIRCMLCPRKGGAFKQTTGGRWAHVVCALWIPETGFSDAEKLEPIENVTEVSKARKKLKCYLCKRAGPCIQCSDQCHTAFHPLCGLFGGQYMAITEDYRNNATTYNACCRKHTPIHLSMGLEIPLNYTRLVKVRRQTDVARSLCDLVRQREQLKMEATQAEFDAMQSQWADAVEVYRADPVLVGLFPATQAPTFSVPFVAALSPAPVFVPVSVPVPVPSTIPLYPLVPLASPVTPMTPATPTSPIVPTPVTYRKKKPKLPTPRVGNQSGRVVVPYSPPPQPIAPIVVAVIPVPPTPSPPATPVSPAIAAAPATPVLSPSSRIRRSRMGSDKRRGSPARKSTRWRTPSLVVRELHDDYVEEGTKVPKAIPLPAPPKTAREKRGDKRHARIAATVVSVPATKSEHSSTDKESKESPADRAGTPQELRGAVETDDSEDSTGEDTDGMTSPTSRSERARRREQSRKAADSSPQKASPKPLSPSRALSPQTRPVPIPISAKPGTPTLKPVSPKPAPASSPLPNLNMEIVKMPRKKRRRWDTPSPPGTPVESPVPPSEPVVKTRFKAVEEKSVQSPSLNDPIQTRSGRNLKSPEPVELMRPVNSARLRAPPIKPLELRTPTLRRKRQKPHVPESFSSSPTLRSRKKSEDSESDDTLNLPSPNLSVEIRSPRARMKASAVASESEDETEPSTPDTSAVTTRARARTLTSPMTTPPPLGKSRKRRASPEPTPVNKEKVEKPDKPDKPDKPGKPGKPDKPDKPEKLGKSNDEEHVQKRSPRKKQKGDEDSQTFEKAETVLVWQDTRYFPAEILEVKMGEPSGRPGKKSQAKPEMQYKVHFGLTRRYDCWVDHGYIVKDNEENRDQYNVTSFVKK